MGYHDLCFLVVYPPDRVILGLIAVDLKDTDDIFNFTCGRFVCNEAYGLSQRHVRFNVNELRRLAAEAVGAKSCVGIEKYPDGMYNKALLLTMENATQVVAKIPNPNAGRPHFTPRLIRHMSSTEDHVRPWRLLASLD